MKINSSYSTVKSKLGLIVVGVGILLSIMSVVTFHFLTRTDAQAASAKDFKPGRIIDDSVFYNANSMNAPQIQAFLNAQVPNCDTNGSGRAVEWGRSDITRATLASYFRNGTNGYKKDSGFHAPPYTCLRDYKQNTPQMEAASGLCGGLSAKQNQSAAQIIKDVAMACGINPQVLLVLLQKEQSLVTDIWPLQRQFRSATGFDCPDTAPCDPAYAGFFYQVYHAARQFKVYQKYPNSYNYVAGRTNRIYWHPDLSRCGSSQVYIENQATAALYIYTPYRPNTAAMNNLYGTGDSCSSYGNRNFWRLFTDWFGSTFGNIFQVGERVNNTYVSLGGSTGRLGNPTSYEICNLSDTACTQNFQGGSIHWTQAKGAHALVGSIRKQWIELGGENSSLGYPIGPETQLDNGGWQQEFQSGFIVGSYGTGYWPSKGSIRNYWVTIGADKSDLGLPIGPETARGSGWQQEYQNGFIVGSYGTGYWMSKGSIRKYWLSADAEAGALGFPVGPETQMPSGGWQQEYQSGYIVGSYATGYWASKGSIRVYWLSIDADQGPLGLPVGPEMALKGGWQQEYQNGFIVGSHSSGYWISKGSIRKHWVNTGAEKGPLGYPTGAETLQQDGKWRQQYQNGYIIGNYATGYKSYITKG